MAVKVQDHVHISMALGGSPENSPTLKWTITRWSLQPRVTMNLRYGQTGKLRKHRLRNENGIIQYFDYKYIVKLGESTENPQVLAQRRAELLAMNGQDVYLVDSNHPDDGENHASHVKNMVLKVDAIENYEFALRRFYVAIELIDDNN